jgi:hypothetical protein
MASETTEPAAEGGARFTFVSSDVMAAQRAWWTAVATLRCFPHDGRQWDAEALTITHANGSLARVLRSTTSAGNLRAREGWFAD